MRIRLGSIGVAGLALVGATFITARPALAQRAIMQPFAGKGATWPKSSV